MKKSITVVTVLLLALIIMRFIPVSRKKEMLIKNKMEHVNNYVTNQRNWIKWHPALKAAWENDSTSVQTRKDADSTAFTFTFSGKEIRVTDLSNLQYHVEQSGENNTADFIFSISPDQNSPYTKVVYAKQSNLLFTLIPTLQKSNESDTVLYSLRHALEDVRSFYGFDITLQPAEGKAYMVKRLSTVKQKALNNLPEMFSGIERWIKIQDGGIAKNYSISYIPLKKDSVEIMAGIALEKIIPGNDSIDCMKIPAKQFLVVGKYEGNYAKKNELYAAMSLYMMDNRLPQSSAFFERFETGKMPQSDSSTVKMQLCIPYYQR